MKNFVFIIALFLFSVSASVAQNGVLVAGNPPLAQTDFENVVQYYERGLGIEFSPEEREELQQIVVRNWRRSQKISPQNLTKWLETIRKINGISVEKREKIQDELQEAVLGDLRASSGSDLSRFVLGVYENSGGAQSRPAQTEAAPTDREPEKENRPPSNEPVTPYTDQYKPVEGGIRLSDLAGKWSKSTVSASGYRNVVTGDYKSGYGFSNQHEIRADGGFDYYNFATVSLYDCTTELFTSMKGRAQLSGSQITFSYVSGTVSIKDSCKKSNVTKPAQIARTTFRIERGSKYLRMCETGKESPYCLYKAED